MTTEVTTKHHSPSPWRYDFEPDYCGEFIAANGESIATFADKPNEADTRLMIAAPELLAELQNIANTKRFDRDYFPTDADFIEWAQSRARFAIAKTLGAAA